MNKKWVATGLVLATALGATSYFATSTTATPVANKNAQQVSSIVPIQDKMLNAVDYYKDLQGTYHEVNAALGIDNTVDFSIQEGAAPGSYVSIRDNKSGNVSEHTADGKGVMHYEPNKKQYVQHTYDRSTFNSYSPNRISTDANGEKHYVYRQDPAFANLASDVTLPQVYAFWLSTAPYQITGHEMLLGRDTTVIEGRLDSYLAEKRHAANYKMWVDTATGVLLKKVETTSAGDPVDTLEVTSVQFDSGKVDAAKFQIHKPLNAVDVTQKEQSAQQ